MFIIEEVDSIYVEKYRAEPITYIIYFKIGKTHVCTIRLYILYNCDNYDGITLQFRMIALGKQ